MIAIVQTPSHELYQILSFETVAARCAADRGELVTVATYKDARAFRRNTGMGLRESTVKITTLATALEEGSTPCRGIRADGGLCHTCR